MFRSFFPDEYLDSAYVIDYEKLYREGYRGLLFDIDNSINSKAGQSFFPTVHRQMTGQRNCLKS